MSPWIGPGPDDRDFDDQVVVRARPQPRQHRHLRARLDLEHAHGVGVADHVVDRRVFGGHGRERPALAAAAVHEVERAADRGEHAEAEHVDLEQAELVEVVLVPLDHGAVGHRGVLDRHEFLEQVARDDESADVLREMPRKAEHGPRERQHLRQHRDCRDRGPLHARAFRRCASRPTTASSAPGPRPAAGRAPSPSPRRATRCAAGS